MIIEICANGIESARIAQDAGADRIELCLDLSVGGLTPSQDLIEKVVKEITIPVHVLIRPRSGDFCYSEGELDTMIQDIVYCKQLGCAGVVSGVLSRENNVDVSATKQLINASEGMQFTFHRAFDACQNPMQNFSKLLELQVTRLLSSGQRIKAIDGLPFLKELQSVSNGKIEIQPGGGINSDNTLLFKEAGFEMIHFSATKKEPAVIESDELFKSNVVSHSNSEEIKKVIQLLA